MPSSPPLVLRLRFRGGNNRFETFNKETRGARPRFAKNFDPSRFFTPIFRPAAQVSESRNLFRRKDLAGVEEAVRIEQRLDTHL
jgi:hypothetical protein